MTGSHSKKYHGSKKKFLIPDPNTIWLVIGMFQTKFTLKDVLRLGKAWVLSSDDWTHMLEHKDENFGASVHGATAELGFKHETVHTTLKEEGYFSYRILVLHDGTKCQMLKEMTTLLEPSFEDGLNLIWPARSLDLSAPDFYLRSFLKDSARRNQPRREEEMKDAIEVEIKVITECTCKSMFKNMLRQINACQAIYDSQFQHQM